MSFLMRWLTAGCLAVAVAGCQTTPDPRPVLVQEGERLFFEETFDGNGRTCGTCHRAEDNFGLTPAFIAALPPDDPLFLAETNPDLANGFEKPALMRRLAMIVENQDGFDDLNNNFNTRGIPHTLAMRQSIDSAAGPRTGWSGDGSPGDGSLRSFAIGAVIQHFPKTLNRLAGSDFRLPTPEELDALEAFQLSLGRQQDISLPLALTSPVAQRGQEIFMSRAIGKCNACHFNAGANGDPGIFGPGAGNLNFNTGVEAITDQPADLIDPDNPSDDGFGVPGNGEFNVPTVVEAADTAPFFHNNSVATLEGAVAFYNTPAFNDSPAGLLIKGATGAGIDLSSGQVDAVAGFLRVVNALENIRASDALLERAINESSRRSSLARLAGFEIEDAIEVLEEQNLHAAAVASLREAFDGATDSPTRDTLRTAREALATAPVRHDRRRIMKMIPGAAILCALAVGLPTAAHQLTEQYIPIGQSPGIESRRIMGEITARTEQSVEVGGRSVQMNDGTRVWLDRSAAGRSAVVGDSADCSEGRYVEIKTRSEDGELIAEWIKIRADAR